MKITLKKITLLIALCTTSLLACEITPQEVCATGWRRFNPTLPCDNYGPIYKFDEVETLCDVIESVGRDGTLYSRYNKSITIAMLKEFKDVYDQSTNLFHQERKKIGNVSFAKTKQQMEYKKWADFYIAYRTENLKKKHIDPNDIATFLSAVPFKSDVEVQSEKIEAANSYIEALSQQIANQRDQLSYYEESIRRQDILLREKTQREEDYEGIIKTLNSVVGELTQKKHSLSEEPQVLSTASLSAAVVGYDENSRPSSDDEDQTPITDEEIITAEVIDLSGSPRSDPIISMVNNIGETALTPVNVIRGKPSVSTWKQIGRVVRKKLG